MKLDPRIFPTILIVLDFIAAIPYAFRGYARHAVYWVAGEMDMPMFGGRIKGSLVHIPIRRFLDWYCYVGQN